MAQFFTEAPKEELPKEKEFNFAQIEALKKPIENILTELKDEIDSGQYKMILGDDASGRIPADIFGNVLRLIYKDHNLDVPQIRFIAANPDIPWGPLDAAIKQFKRGLETNESDKVLIVTDTIASGRHLQPVVNSFHKNGVKFDVATIGVAGDNLYETVDLLQKQWNCNIVCGELGVPSIYNQRDLGGVFKEYGDIVARPRKQNGSRKQNARVTDDPKVIQQKINMAREDVDKLALEIYEWYRFQSKN